MRQEPKAQSPDVLYVDLDALLDTRIATLALHDSTAAAEAVKSESYFNRDINDFSEWTDLTVEQFNELYAKRDVRTLKGSFRTHIPALLERILMDLTAQELTGPTVTSPKVFVNSYPYQLSEEEREMLGYAIAHFAGINVPVTVGSIPYENLTPTVIQKQFSGLIFYNFRDWLAFQHETLKKTKLQETLVIAPQLYHEKRVGVDEYRYDNMREDVDPWDLFKVGFLELFDIQTIPMSQYCIDLQL